MAPETILVDFGLTAADLVGEGGESRVYALDAERVLRIPRTVRPNAIPRKELRWFLAGIAGRLPFATPEIMEIGPNDEWTIEKRLPGTAMLTLLRTLAGAERQAAFRNYLDAVNAFSAIPLPAERYGHLLAPAPVRTEEWRTFAERTLTSFVAANKASITREVGKVKQIAAKAQKMTAALTEQPAKVLVHGDYFPGNVMMNDAGEVTAVLDFGVFTLAGDAQLDLAVAYLTLELLEECTADDAAFVRDLVLAQLGKDAEPALAFWRAWLAFSMADPANAAPPYPKLYEWSLRQLSALAAGQIGA